MGANISNAIQVMRHTLLEESDITDLVGSRVVTDHIIDYENQTFEMPCIIIDLQSGQANYARADQRLVFHVYVYSKESSAESFEIYDVVYEKLSAVRLNIDDISAKGYSREAERPIHGYNNDVKGWYCRATYITWTA